jgi:cytochrome c-type biogenesis protein CcmH
MTRTEELKSQLTKLDELIRAGSLTGKPARQARDKIEAELLAAVLQPDTLARHEVAAAKPSARLMLGLAAFVLLFGAAGYSWLGNREGLALAPGVVAPPQADAGQHEIDAPQIEAMAQRLADRLKTQPDDAEGWAMLGRSYGVLGRYPQALAAYQRVLDLRPQDAQGYADYADALGMSQGRKLDGEPEKMIARALQLDPDNMKALSLAGTIAFDRGDHKLAVQLWERAQRKLEPSGEMARQLQGGIDEARQRAGMPVVALAAPAAPAISAAASAAGPVAQAGASVQARISLAPALAAKAAPEDTVFIFARALQGSKAPLAILRRQVKDLPLEVTLDDSTAMSPALRLSTQTQVVVGARISKSGNAMPQPGDLQGLSPTVAVGARGVQLVIADIIR